MDSYDIRLRKSDAGAMLVYCTVKDSDAAAIRTAHEVAEDGDSIEVWKGMRCIYAGRADMDISLPLPGKTGQGSGRTCA